MALSQKHVGKMLVPWFNSAEWKSVNTLICGFNSTDGHKLQALETLQMWKVRTPKLPSGVEGTLIILEALFQKEDGLSDNRLRILHGTSIMRFLNLCGAITEKQGTFYKAAKQNKLPDWLVDLRHEIAHNQVIPSEFMLRMGLEFCLDWLKTEYWEKQNAILKDFVIKTDPRHYIKAMVELYCQVNFACYSTNIDSIKDLADFFPTLVEKIDDLGAVEVDSDTDVKDLLKTILGCICEEDWREQEDVLCDVIVNDGTIFSTDLVENESGKEILPAGFVKIWQDLVNVLYSNNMLASLFKKLFSVTSSNETQEQTRKIASMWLAELCKSLLLANRICNKYSALSDYDKLNKEAAVAVLKQIVQKENPALRQCLDLDFQHCKQTISELNSFRLNVLADANNFTPIFCKPLLQVCGCTEIYIDETEASLNAYLIPPSGSSNANDHIHTVEEFPDLCTDATMNAISTNMEQYSEPEIVSSNSVAQTKTVSNGVAQTNTVSNGVAQKRWRLVEDTSVFQGCPLGVLAFQNREVNPLVNQSAL